jgi:hypothetical protein
LCLSVVTSVMGDIPPPCPQVQSHAVLEVGLGHAIPVSPRTPGAQRRLYTAQWAMIWTKLPQNQNPQMRSAVVRLRSADVR